MPVEHQLDVIFKKLDKIDDRLFKDNGGKCMQTRVNYNSEMIMAQERRWKWVFGTTTALIIMVLGRILYDIFW